MFPSILLYIGIVILSAGALSIIYPLRFLLVRTRAQAGLVFLAGLILSVVALAIPAREMRVTKAGSRIDDFMPVWQFDERHSISVNAPPEQVFEAIRAVTANEILLFRTMTWIRRLGRPGAESILNAPEDQPIIDVATRTTFVVLANDAPRDLVIATVIFAPRRTRSSRGLSPDLFRRELPPGVALATMNFLVESNGAGGSLVSTETRVFASSPSSVRRFRIYWRFIRPGSDIIRRMWLRAIKIRAESPSAKRGGLFEIGHASVIVSALVGISPYAGSHDPVGIGVTDGSTARRSRCASFLNRSFRRRQGNSMNL